MLSFYIQNQGGIDVAENKGYIKNTDEKGSINISEDVVAVIAVTAAAEVEGVYEPCIAPGKDTVNILGRRASPKGVKLSIDGDKITVEINIIAQFGFSVSEVGAAVQKAISLAVEGTTGVTVQAVNVNICGVALKRK